MAAQDPHWERGLIHVRELGIQAVLFDMDGVLVDSLAAHLQAWNAAFEHEGLASMDRPTYLTLTGRTNREMLNAYADLHKYDLSAAAKSGIIDRKENLLRETLRTHARTTPGVSEWLQYLEARRLPCGVASSGEMANIVAVLEALRIASYFMSVLSGSLLPASKPDPRIFQLAAASLGAAPSRCLVIEDSPLGIRAAKAAGMACCALATTLPESRLSGADIVIENLAGLDPHTLFDTQTVSPGEAE